MPAYRMLATKLFQPTWQPVPGALAPGEWVNGEWTCVLECYGELKLASSELVATPLGQAARECCHWRGKLPDEVKPEPGWEAEIDKRRYRVLAVMWMIGRTWRLDLERIE